MLQHGNSLVGALNHTFVPFFFGDLLSLDSLFLAFDFSTAEESANTKGGDTGNTM
jgi:hypothetical protein